MSKKVQSKKVGSKDLNLIKEELHKKLASKQCILLEISTPSKVWKHFKVIQDTDTGKATGYVHCSDCKGIFKHDSSGTGTSHLHKHLESCSNRSRRPTTQAIDVASTSGGSTISQFFKPKTVVTKKIKQEMLVAGMAFCTYDMRPFEVVSGRGLQIWTDKAIAIGVKYGPIPTKDMAPDPTTLSRNIRRLAKTLRASKVPFYQDAMKQGLCSATTDMWTDDFQKHSYTTVTLHYTDSDWVLMKKVLFTLDYPDDKRKTGECMRKDLANKFTSLGFDMDVVQEIIFVTDQGPNIVKALSLSPAIERMNCCAHMLNTILRNIFQPNVICLALPTVYQTLIGAKGLVSFLKHSGLSGRLKKTVHQEVETRWNSRLALLKSVRDNYSEITDILKERPKEIHRLDGINLTAINALIEFLEPFKTASDILEADGCTIHLVLPEYFGLLNFCKPPDQCQPVDDDLTQLSLPGETVPPTPITESASEGQSDEPVIGTHTQADIMSYLKSKAYENLIKKFTINDTHRLATLLSPIAKKIGLRHRPYYLSMTYSERNKVIEKLRDSIRYDSMGDSQLLLDLSQAAESQAQGMSDESLTVTPCSSASATPPVKRKRKLSPHNRLQLFVENAMSDDEPEALDLDEVDRYFNSTFTKAEAETDVLQWWRKNEDTYPKLSKIARKILNTPASSAASERVFSAAGNIVQEKRSSLLPETVDALLFLASNAEVKDFTLSPSTSDESSDEEA